MARKPTTLNPYLPSAGYDYRIATLHTFVETRECQLTGRSPSAWEHIFRCTETGEERRWGIEDKYRWEGN